MNKKDIWDSKLVMLAVIVTLLFMAAQAFSAEGSTQDQLVAVMQENFAACNHEDLPRLLDTMSEEMPQRELFIRQTKAEWEASDLYYRLDGLQIVRQNKWRPPYTVATVRQTITGNEGKVDDPGLSDMMNLNTELPTTEYELLFKRENGKWKVVAGLTQPRAVNSQNIREAKTKGSCANGSCSFPRRAPAAH